MAFNCFKSSKTVKMGTNLKVALSKASKNVSSDKNFVCSPLGIEILLSVLANGSTGATRSQIYEFLGINTLKGINQKASAYMEVVSLNNTDANFVSRNFNIPLKRKKKLRVLSPEIGLINYYHSIEKMAITNVYTNYLHTNLLSLSHLRILSKSTKICRFSVVNCSNSSLIDAHTSNKKWRREFRVSELSEDSVKDAAKTGKAYVHDLLDVNGRPVLLVVASKHITGMLDPLEDEKLCVFLVKKALSMLPPGKEDILGIFDLRGFGNANADLKFLTFLFNVFYYYYPRRLGQVLFVDAPFVFQPIRQLTKPLVKQYASLVRFCSVKTVREEYFTEETLPATFRD